MQSRQRKAASLLIIASLVCVVWVVVLPRVAQWDVVRERIERNERAGINAGATFYSELGDVKGITLDRENGKWVTRPLKLGD